MTINLMTIEPHKISRDLKGKIVCIYGEPKVGKSTIAASFDRTLLLAFEKGYNALSGVMVQPLSSWAEFKRVLTQLKTKEVKEKFSTIAIDTADIAFDLAEKFICSREGVDKIGDIPFGAGYKMLRNEFNEALRSIPMMDYGLVNISHSQVATFTNDEGQEYSKTVPTLPKAARHIVLSMSDIIGYAKPVENAEGERKVALFLRGTAQFEAGSRFKHTPPVIPFEYDALVNAISDAIEKEEEEKPNSVTDTVVNLYEESEGKSFEELKAEINNLLTLAMQGKDEEQRGRQAEVIKEVIESHLGKGRLLKDAKESQKDHVELILLDLESIINKK